MTDNSELTRYEIIIFEHNWMHRESPDGEYVKFEEAAKALRDADKERDDLLYANDFCGETIKRIESENESLQARVAELEKQLDRIKQESPEAYQWLVNINARIYELEELTAADKLEIGSYREGTGLRGENRAQGQRIAELRRSIDNIKVRAYELGQIELHDMALESLKGDV